MDPVLSGSLCFLVLAIVMYIKFIREHPWADEDDASVTMGDRCKTSPVEPDTMPFLHPTSPVSVLQAQKKMHQQRQQQQQAQRNQGSQPVLRGPFKKVMQATSAAAVGAAGASISGASTQYLHNKKQPMRRRTHSATLAGASSGMHGGNGKSASVANSVTGGGGSVDTASAIAMAMDQLPTTIYETRQEHFHRDEKPPLPLQQVPPPSSGRNQHRINFDLSDEDEFDEEMGFLSPRRHSDAANDSLDSVPFEADDASDDGFTDLENHLSEFDRGDSDFRRAGGAGVHRQHDGARGGTKAAAPSLVTPSKADTLKTTIDRQFVREAVPPPAQMQLEVARKARIPLFLHSPMYVRTSAAPLVDEVEMLEMGDGDGKASPVNPEVGRGGSQDAAAAAVAATGAGAGAGQGAGGAGGAGAAAVGGAAAAYAHARRRGKLPNKMKNQSLHIDFNELQVAEMIGQGAFGTVHRAMWRGTAVAVKILVCQYLTVDILEEFETEVQIMSILRHPNICLLMGACLEPPTRCLVIEYLPRGSLWNVLRQDVVIDLNKQLGFARDTALGMNYLHSFQPPILHRDLKSPNLLIDLSYALKISDFGLARVRAHFQTMTGNCGTTQWMAPEVLAAEKYTEKADVFSYGVVVWETVTRECPYEGLSQIQAALGVLNNNLRPTIPENCPPLFKKIMTLCWVSNPEERPTFEAVLDILHRSSDGLLPPEDAGKGDASAHRGA